MGPGRRTAAGGLPARSRGSSGTIRVVTGYRIPRPLDPVELRVLGCLLEKELSTPDHYPLSLNALKNAANQRSNRDPVLDLDEEALSSALEALLGEVLVWRVRSSRVLKWEHNLDDKWDLGEAGKAVLAELLLRGPQTPGELRSRCSRMHDFEELEAVDETLERLAGGGPALVERLPQRPGQKEARWAHRLGEPRPDREEGTAGGEVSAPLATPEPLGARVERLERRVEELAEEVAELRSELG